MQIIFHLGAYKTGTSSFQNAIYENREALLARGILYPNTGLKKGKKLGHRHTQLFEGFMAGTSDLCPQALIAELKTSDARVAILSSEAWAAPRNLPLLT